MQMILIDERGIAFIAPRFRVEMQTENEVRMQPCINKLRPVPDLAIPIKENFALPPNGLFFEQVGGSIVILARVFRSTRP